MLKIDKKEENISIVGGSETLKNEIGTLMLALCGEAAKQSKDAAIDIYTHYLATVAYIARYLKEKHHIDVDKFLEVFLKEDEEEEEPEAPPSISQELDDAINTFFSALDNIIAKKKGDK